MLVGRQQGLAHSDQPQRVGIALRAVEEVEVGHVRVDGAVAVPGELELGVRPMGADRDPLVAAIPAQPFAQLKLAIAGSSEKAGSAGSGRSWNCGCISRTPAVAGAKGPAIIQAGVTGWPSTLPQPPR